MYYYNPKKFQLKTLSVVILLTLFVSLLVILPDSTAAAHTPSTSSVNILQQQATVNLEELQVQIYELTQLQLTTYATLESQQGIEQIILEIHNDISNRNYSKAIFQTDLLSQHLSQSIKELTTLQKRQATHNKYIASSQTPVELPILMYHKTPPDFSTQLDSLQSKGYNTITMAQLANYFDGIIELPPKPVVITFDDGFADQMDAFMLLRQRNMKATFYLIPGGARSGWCIGIMRHNLNCGDSYLNWPQVHLLQDSGLIEIGAHTLDHSDLPTLSQDEQIEQITSSRRILEKELQVPVTTFAYPYGKFNETTVALTKQVGFRTAVSTVGGITQSSNNRFSLLRVRDALILP